MHPRSLLAVTALVGAACSTETLSAPDPGPPASSWAITSPKSYGFMLDPGATAAVAITDGLSLQCTKSGSGSARYTLTLTGRNLSEVQSTLAAGGTAAVEVPTTMKFTGTGVMAADETIAFSGGGATGTFSAVESSFNPGAPYVIFPHLATFPLTLANFATAGPFEVNLTGLVSNILPLCGVSSAGLVKWTYSFPVIRLIP